MLILTREPGESVCIGTGHVVQANTNNLFSIFSETEKERSIKLQIGESCEVTKGVVMHYLGFKGNQRKIGFEASREIDIHREEILKRILQERKQAQALTNQASKVA